MWLLEYLNFLTGPIIMVWMILVAVVTYCGTSLLSPSNITKWLRRVSLALGCSGIAIGFLTTVLYVPFAMLSCLVFDAWLADWHDNIEVHGVVVDGESGDPISDARIVVHAAASVYMSHQQYDYATISNDAGEFRLSTRLPQPCNSVSLEAVTPENHLARADWNNAKVILESELITDAWALKENFQYEHFTGFAYGDGITFQCEPWLPEKATLD